MYIYFFNIENILNGKSAVVAIVNAGIGLLPIVKCWALLVY